MNWALVVIYVCMLFNLIVSSNKHGKPRDDWNFWFELCNVVGTLALVWWATGWRFI